MTLEAHYVLDEDSGSTAYDYSGNGFNGTLNGGAGPSGTGTVTGPFGNSAYDFYLADDYINITDVIGATNNYTLSAWAKSQNDLADSAHLFGFRDSSGDWQITFGATDGAGFGSDGQAFIRDERSATSGTATSTTIVDGAEWHHICATATRNGELAIYVDGVKEGTDTLPNTQMNTQSTDQYINAFNNVGSGTVIDRWGGPISDFRVYKRTLSPQEVQALYQAGTRAEVVFE